MMWQSSDMAVSNLQLYLLFELNKGPETTIGTPPNMLPYHGLSEIPNGVL